MSLHKVYTTAPLVKSATLFNLAEDQIIPDNLNELLSARMDRDLGTMELSHIGWGKLDGISTVTNVQSGLATISGIMLVRREKVFIAASVKEEVERIALETENETGRPVGRKERNDIKERVLLELAPNAPVRVKRTYAYIDQINRQVVVGSASNKDVEDTIELLRKCLGSFNVLYHEHDEPLDVVMTKWVMNGGTGHANLHFTDSCVLKRGSASVAIKKVDTNANTNAKNLIDEGFTVQRVGLTIDSDTADGFAEFTLDEDFRIRSIKGLSLGEDDLDAQADHESTLAANMILCHGTIIKIIAVIGE